MRPGQIFPFLLLAASLLHPACMPAMGTPLSATADTSTASTPPVWAPLSPELLLQSNPGSETRADAFLLGTAASMQGFQQSTGGDPWDGRNARAVQSAGPGLAEQFRHLINVGSIEGTGPAQTRSGNRGARGAPAGFAGIDMGEATEQWLRDTVQSLVDSTLRLEMNESGRASFSLLGLGDFSLSISADRSQIALSEGNEALFTVDRPTAAGAGGSTSDTPLGAVRGGHGVEQPAIKQVVELVAEMASHPISLLVYCVVAAYLVLWNVLSHQRNKALTPVRRFEPVYSEPVAAERSGSRRRSRRRSRRTHSRRSSA
jgi:hypothetical protein